MCSETCLCVFMNVEIHAGTCTRRWIIHVKGTLLSDHVTLLSGHVTLLSGHVTLLSGHVTLLSGHVTTCTCI